MNWTSTVLYRDWTGRLLLGILRISSDLSVGPLNGTHSTQNFCSTSRLSFWKPKQSVTRLMWDLIQVLPSVTYCTCRNPGLNQEPLDLQSNALPTELFRLASAQAECIFVWIVNCSFLNKYHTILSLSENSPSHWVFCTASHLPKPGIEPGTFRSSV